MQLPNELWYMIFKIRTKIILEEHYDSWTLKHKEFNKQIMKTIKWIKYDSNRQSAPYTSPYYETKWGRDNHFPSFYKRQIELKWDIGGDLCWFADTSICTYIYDYNNKVVTK